MLVNFFNNTKLIFDMAFRNVINNMDKNKIIILIIAVSFILIQILLASSIGLGLQVRNFALDALLGDFKIMHTKYKLNNEIKYNFYISQQQLDKIRSIDGVAGVTTRVQVPLVIKSAREFRNATLVGIDLRYEKELSFIGKEYGYSNFSKVLKDNQLIVGNNLKDTLQTKIGYKIILSGQDVKEDLLDLPFFIKDVFNTNLPAFEDMFLFANLDVVQKKYHLGDNVTEVSIRLLPNTNAEHIYQQINQLLPDDTKLYTWGELMVFLKSWLDMMLVNLLIFFGVVFVAACIPLGNNILMSVLERVNEFGILQALGMRKLYVSLLIICEAFITLLIGLLSGLVVAIPLTLLLSYTGINISSMAQGASQLGLSDYIYPIFNFYHTLMILITILVIGLLFSVYPAIKIYFYNIVDAISKKV